MKLITERDLILGVADAWEKKYGPRKNGKIDYPEHFAELPALRALNLRTCTKADVTAIISDSWVSIQCHDCGSWVDAVVQVGQEPDYESSTAQLCRSCIRKAFDLAATIPAQANHE